jgi:hypothetical protein
MGGVLERRPPGAGYARVAPMTDVQKELRDEVAERITARGLLDAYGIRYRPGGGRNELSAKECPSRSDHSSPSFRFNEKKKLWRCWSCNTSGDVFAFVAAMEGLDCTCDFAQVLARAAEIAGVTPATVPPAERAQRITALRQRRAAREQAQRELAEREDTMAIRRATAYWNSLSLRHPLGERYLEGRGIVDVADTHGRVRFDRTDAPGHDHWSSNGAPALALHDLRGRGISGVVRRRLPEVVARDPRGVKAPSLTGCRSSGTMAYALEEIEPERDVIVAEGIADTITALVAWPHAVVLGANGTGPLPTLIDEIAKRVVRARCRMFLVPHADERRQGEIAMAAGIERAIHAGLRLGYDVIIVDLGTEKDLNDAWCTGWRFL